MSSESRIPILISLAGLEDAYDQVQKMAIGGMAEVYRGRQKALDRPVAIKRIRAELRSNRDIQERFRREARSSANLLHQNLAHVYDYKSVGDDAYIIMEWIDGFDLAEIIERTGALPIEVATFIAVKILNGLSYVHTHGMVHRDLKPDNVRVSTRGDVKIMDFGIALDPGESNLTMPGTLIGSPHYLSPEQITGAKIDSRADLFSFGITFYEMLTGKKPFYETEKETVYSNIQKGEYIEPEKRRVDLPAFLSKIIQSCLETKAARRPSSADQVSAALMQFLATNYSVDADPRIRKFLIQSGLLQGNPQLIEVDERTSPGIGGKTAVMGFLREKRTVRIVLAGIILGMLGGLSYVLRDKIKAMFSDSAIEGKVAPASEHKGSLFKQVIPRLRDKK